MNRSVRVGVLGGGMSGLCTALELAENGCEVTLFEQEPELLSCASFWCEGKVHLGFVYANDPTGKTARIMIRGALQFRPLLERWIPKAVVDSALSSPFLYAVHKHGMLGADAVSRHFELVRRIYGEEIRAPGAAPLAPLDGPLVEPLGIRRHRDLFDADHILESYATAERSVDPWPIAEALRQSARSAERLWIRCSTKVVAVRPKARGVEVAFCDADGKATECFDHVVNATWQNRLALDATAGFVERRPVIHRFKVGLNSIDESTPPNLPSVTYLFGVFGDTVCFARRRYLNWYHAGHILTDRTLHPPENVLASVKPDLAEIARTTVQQLQILMPGAARELEAPKGGWLVNGGYITAWGQTGIEHLESRLHQRHDIGVASFGSYHSLDPGKYTTAPLLAHEACSRVLGRARVRAA